MDRGASGTPAQNGRETGGEITRQGLRGHVYGHPPGYSCRDPSGFQWTRPFSPHAWRFRVRCEKPMHVWAISRRRMETPIHSGRQCRCSTAPLFTPFEGLIQGRRLMLGGSFQVLITAEAHARVSLGARPRAAAAPKGGGRRGEASSGHLCVRPPALPQGFSALASLSARGLPPSSTTPLL